MLAPHSRTVVSLAWVMMAAQLCACSSGQDIALAEAQIPHFRHLMAEQKFEQIYSEASEDLQKATSQEDMVALLAAVDRKLGPVKTTQKNGWNINIHTSGTFVTLGVKTQFERGAADETFVYRIDNGEALLAGYNINSNALIVN